MSGLSLAAKPLEKVGISPAWPGSDWGGEGALCPWGHWQWRGARVDAGGSGEDNVPWGSQMSGVASPLWSVAPEPPTVGGGHSGLTHPLRGPECIIICRRTTAPAQWASVASRWSRPTCPLGALVGHNTGAVWLCQVWGHTLRSKGLCESTVCIAQGYTSVRASVGLSVCTHVCLCVHLHVCVCKYRQNACVCSFFSC